MKTAVGLTVLILGLAVGQAVSGPVGSMNIQDVRVELQLDKAAYGLGETVEIRLVLTNTAQITATLKFPTGQMYDFVVTRGGQLIWQWSHGKMFTQAFTALTLNPGETKIFTERWDQRSTQSQQVPAAEYEMAAVFPVGGGGLVPTGSSGPRVQFGISGRSKPSRPQRMPSATSRPAIIDGATGGEVLVNSQVVLRIRTAAGGFSAARRAEIVATRLQRLLAQHLRLEELAAVPLGTEAAIFWRHQLVVTVDSNHARLANTAPFNLAEEWLKALTQALSAAQ